MPTTIDHEQKTCAGCGARLNAYAPACPTCGRSQPPPEEVASTTQAWPAPQPAPNWPMILLAWTLTVLAYTAGLYGLQTLMGPSQGRYWTGLAAFFLPSVGVLSIADAKLRRSPQSVNKVTGWALYAVHLAGWVYVAMNLRAWTAAAFPP